MHVSQKDSRKWDKERVRKSLKTSGFSSRAAAPEFKIRAQQKQRNTFDPRYKRTATELDGPGVHVLTVVTVTDLPTTPCPSGLPVALCLLSEDSEFRPVI